MIDDASPALREIRSGPVARVLLADIVALAEREGVLSQIRRLAPVRFETLCAALRADLGYALDQGNRRRMISLLLDLLAECGRMKQAGGAWHWCGEDSTLTADGGTGGVPTGDTPAALDEQYAFFRACLASVPRYLRGPEATMRFDRGSAEAWERFLGCAEFRTCRALLLVLMGIEKDPPPRVLDLCHGPGWGVEAVLRRFPAARVTALDFTDTFRRTAQARAEQAQDRNLRDGHPTVPIVWVGPDRWAGLGKPLPFTDGVFDAVLFTCGDPYIPPARRADVYRDIGRVLAPGGRLGVLTRCRPDGSARHVVSFWLRISALAHDFAESVCEGWEGFADADENLRMFADAGFQGSGDVPGTMSFFDASLWVLRKGRLDA